MDALSAESMLSLCAAAGIGAGATYLLCLGPAGTSATEKPAYMRFEIDDMNGVSRSKTIPMRHADKDVYMPSCVHGLGSWHAVMKEGATLFKESVDNGCCNTKMVPDWSTKRKVTFARSPDEHETYSVMCEQLEPGDDSMLLPDIPRTTCLKQLAKLKAKGYEMFFAHELEFTLMQPKGSPSSAPTNPGDVDGWEAAIPGIDFAATFRTCMGQDFAYRLEQTMRDLDIDIRSINAENGDGQLEITYAPAFGITGPDNSFRYKNGVKELAMTMGLHATFMCKPLIDGACNGGHSNHSLWTTDESGKKKCAFFDPDSPDKLSAVAKHWIAGVLKHGKALQALVAPTVSCYNRYKIWSWSPTSCCWG